MRQCGRLVWRLRPQIKARARSATFDFNQPEWDVVSDSAKDLLRKLIVKNPAVCIQICFFPPLFACVDGNTLVPSVQHELTDCNGAVLSRVQHRLDSRGIVAHEWFQARLPSKVLSEEMGSRISGYQVKYRRKLKASIYGSFFVASLRSMSALSLSMRCVAVAWEKGHTPLFCCHPHHPW